MPQHEAYGTTWVRLNIEYLAGRHLITAHLCPRLGAPQPGGVQGGRECPAGAATAS